MNDFFTTNTKQPKEIIEGVLREGQFATLSGPYGICKSPLLQNITICRLNGLNWCGRAVKKGPVIVFDFETPGPTYRKNLKQMCSRYDVPLPTVPVELEVYLEHDDPKADGTAQLLDLLEQSTEKKIEFIENRLRDKPDASVIIDPLELLFPIDKNKGDQVVKLYNKFRRLLAEYPHAFIFLTFNMRKRDRRAKMPSLFTDPRGWLEETSGSGAIQYRADVRLGIDIYDAEKEIRVINGIRRGEEMYPLLIQSVGDPDKLAGFESATNVEVLEALTQTQRKHWKALPHEFKFEEVAGNSVPRSTLHRLLSRAKSTGLITGPDENGVWQKQPECWNSGTGWVN